MCILMYKPLQTSGRWAHFLLRESDRNLSTWLIIPQLQQFIVCFLQGHLYQQPNKSALPAFVPKRPHALSVTQAIQDVFQLICNHLGLASHKPGIYIYIYHFSLAGNTVTTPVFSESCFSFPFSTHFIQLFLSSGDKELAVRGKKKNSCDFKEELFFLISCLYFSIIVWSCLKQLKAWLILLKGCGTSAFRMGLPWNGVGCQDLVFQYPEAVCSICGDGDWNF